MISALTLIILSLTNVLTINSNNEHYIDFVHGYQTGLSFALFVFPCINLISNFFLAKNEVKLIEKYIMIMMNVNYLLLTRLGEIFLLPLRLLQWHWFL